MVDHPAYHKTAPAERAEILTTLLEEWSKDWDDDFGKRSDGGMTWTVNAVDVMLLVQEIYRLRVAAAMSS